MPEGYEDPRDGQQIIREVHHYHEGGDIKSFGKLKDGLLILAIAALVGVVWNQNVMIAELRVTVANLVEIVKSLQDKK